MQMLCKNEKTLYALKYANHTLQVCLRYKNQILNLSSQFHYFKLGK